MTATGCAARVCHSWPHPEGARCDGEAAATDRALLPHRALIAAAVLGEPPPREARLRRPAAQRSARSRGRLLCQAVAVSVSPLTPPSTASASSSITRAPPPRSVTSALPSPFPSVLLPPSRRSFHPMSLLTQVAAASKSASLAGAHQIRSGGTISSSGAKRRVEIVLGDGGVCGRERRVRWRLRVVQQVGGRAVGRTGGRLASQVGIRSQSVPPAESGRFVATSLSPDRPEAPRPPPAHAGSATARPEQDTRCEARRRACRAIKRATLSPSPFLARAPRTTSVPQESPRSHPPRSRHLLRPLRGA